MQFTGIHHLTAISNDAPGNLAFYTGTLGMRLVKKTVNQDDVGAYHLFYADGEAAPGSDLTFFDWRRAPEQRGANSVTRTGLRVKGEESLRWWLKHLVKAGVRVGEIVTRDNRLTLDFEDHEGQRLALIDDGGKGSANPWSKSPIPTEHQIRGLGPIVMTVQALEQTDKVLTGVTNMRRTREYRNGDVTVHVYEMGEGGPTAELHVAVDPSLPASVQGAGAVHHVAFRTPDAQGYEYWADRLNSLGVRNSGKIDRFYFRSLYFNDPSGVLFEIATDGPGFVADEPADRLGEKLSLPPFLEPRRGEIEAGLKPL